MAVDDAKTEAVSLAVGKHSALICSIHNYSVRSTSIRPVVLRVSEQR